MIRRFPHRAPFCLPPLPGRETEGRQVVGDLRRTGHPTTHATADEIASGVVLVVGTEDEGSGQWGHLARHRAVIPVGNVAAILIDCVVVDLIVEGKLIDALRGIRIGKLRLQNHFVGQPMEVPELALDRVVGGPHGQAGADSNLAIGPIDRLEREVIPPVGQFAKRIGHDLYRPRLERQVEFLPGREPLADHVVLVGQQRPDIESLAGDRRLREGLPHVGCARMRIPGHRIAEQRLPKDVVVKPRPPLALSEEGVNANA